MVAQDPEQSKNAFINTALDTTKLSFGLGIFGVRIMGLWLTNPGGNHEVAGSVLALAQWGNDPALL